MKSAIVSSRRGGPLVLLGMVLLLWTAGRAAMWESPFPELRSSAELSAADSMDEPEMRFGSELAEEIADASEPQMNRAAAASIFQTAAQSGLIQPANGSVFEGAGLGRVVSGSAANIAQVTASPRGQSPARTASRPPVNSVAPPFLVPLGAGSNSASESGERWTMDVTAFYRAGSGSSSISQGRTPVYGASQIAANLQYNINPRSGHKPRAYVRAYRAFVPDGENEAAAGLSARPYGPIPLRVAAEMRVTNNLFGTQVRPAVYAVTELPPVALPFDIRVEAYGGAGYVGGSANTAYVDGQAAITREVISFDNPGSGSGDRRARISIGGGAWGGAQKDASRLDVGPSIRLDLAIGDVPARLTVDWRERVAGDAAPNSGVAATLSTRF